MANSNRPAPSYSKAERKSRVKPEPVREYSNTYLYVLSAAFVALLVLIVWFVLRQ